MGTGTGMRECRSAGGVACMYGALAYPPIYIAVGRLDIDR